MKNGHYDSDRQFVEIPEAEYDNYEIKWYAPSGDLLNGNSNTLTVTAKNMWDYGCYTASMNLRDHPKTSCNAYNEVMLPNNGKIYISSLYIYDGGKYSIGDELIPLEGKTEPSCTISINSEEDFGDYRLIVYQDGQPVYGGQRSVHIQNQADSFELNYEMDVPAVIGQKLELSVQAYKYDYEVGETKYFDSGELDFHWYDPDGNPLEVENSDTVSFIVNKLGRYTVKVNEKSKPKNVEEGTIHVRDKATMFQVSVNDSEDSII